MRTRTVRGALLVAWLLGAFGCDYQLKVSWPDGVEAVFLAGEFPENSFLKITYPDVLEVNDD